MKSRYRLSALMLVAILTGATACGSGAGQGATEATTPPTEVAAPESAAATVGAGTSPSESSAAPSSAPSSAEAAPAEEVLITIRDFEYVIPASIAPGATVTVVNEDDAPHTVTAEDDGFDVDVRGGETVTFTAPEEPGEYAVICVYHPEMSRTLVIR